MKKILTLALSCSFLFSYNVNDKIDEDIAKEIGVKKDIVVIDFFASWCVSCKKELPLINKLSKQMQDVDFIGIDVDEDKQEGLSFQKDFNLAFSVYNDNSQNIISKFNPAGVPAIYIIKNNVVKSVHIGAIDDVDLVIKNDIKKIK